MPRRSRTGVVSPTLYIIRTFILRIVFPSVPAVSRDLIEALQQHPMLPKNPIRPQPRNAFPAAFKYSGYLLHSQASNRSPFCIRPARTGFKCNRSQLSGTLPASRQRAATYTPAKTCPLCRCLPLNLSVQVPISHFITVTSVACGASITK